MNTQKVMCPACGMVTWAHQPCRRCSSARYNAPAKGDYSLPVDNEDEMSVSTPFMKVLIVLAVLALGGGIYYNLFYLPEVAAQKEQDKIKEDQRMSKFATPIEIRRR